MSLFSFKKPIDLTGYTLVIPSVSVGNVPQLAVDLLITSLKLENVGTLWHPGLVASVGADPFYDDAKTLCTACEIYISETFKLAAIQFRSTIETRLVLKFLSDLVECIADFHLKSVCILATGFDYELHNISKKNTLYFHTNGKVTKPELGEVLEPGPNGRLYVSGAGFAVKLYEMIGNKLDALLLTRYVSEGENFHDAQCFLKNLLEFVDVKVESFTYPASWRYVHGPPPPMEMF